MIIKIKTDAELYSYQEATETHGKPIAHTICNVAKIHEKEVTLEIQIHYSLLSDTYKINPSLLAATIAPRTPFVYCRGLKRPPFSVIHLTNDSTPLSFFKRVTNVVADDSVLEVPVSEIPDSYRYQLHLLRYKVKQFTGFKLKIKKLKTKHVYSRA